MIPSDLYLEKWLSLWIKNQPFALFSRFILVIPTKHNRGLSRGKEHLVPEYDLKWPRHSEMAAILKVKKFNFSTFFSPNRKLLYRLQQNWVPWSRMHCRKRDDPWWPWPWQRQPYIKLNIWLKILNGTFLHCSPNLFQLFQRNVMGTFLGVRSTLSQNITTKWLWELQST